MADPTMSGAPGGCCTCPPGGDGDCDPAEVCLSVGLLCNGGGTALHPGPWTATATDLGTGDTYSTSLLGDGTDPLDAYCIRVPNQATYSVSIVLENDEEYFYDVSAHTVEVGCGNALAEFEIEPRHYQVLGRFGDCITCDAASFTYEATVGGDTVTGTELHVDCDGTVFAIFTVAKAAPYGPLGTGHPVICGTTLIDVTISVTTGGGRYVDASESDTIDACAVVCSPLIAATLTILIEIAEGYACWGCYTTEAPQAPCQYPVCKSFTLTGPAGMATVTYCEDVDYTDPINGWKRGLWIGHLDVTIYGITSIDNALSGCPIVTFNTGTLRLLVYMTCDGFGHIQLHFLWPIYQVSCLDDPTPGDCPDDYSPVLVGSTYRNGLFGAFHSLLTYGADACTDNDTINATIGVRWAHAVGVGALDNCAHPPWTVGVDQEIDDEGNVQDWCADFAALYPACPCPIGNVAAGEWVAGESCG